MDSVNLKQYQKSFFSGTWFNEYRLNRSSLFNKIQDRTDLLLDGKIIFNDSMDMEPHKVPYSINEYKWNHYPEADQEWTFMLSRQGFMVDLAICYKMTNQVKYLNRWKELSFDFIKNNGKPISENTLSWRPLDVGIRLSNLVKSLIYFDLEVDFNQQERKILYSAIIEHKNYLLDSYITKYDLSNWGVLALSGLMQASLLFPTLLTQEETDWVCEKMKTQLNLQFLSDGVHWEQSPLYHHEVLMSFAFLLNISEYLNANTPLDLRKALEKPAVTSYFFINDAGYMNPINDSDYVDFNYVYDIYRYIGLLDGEPINKDAEIYVGHLYVDRYKNHNNKPPNEFHNGEASGFYAVKNKDTYLTFFNGLKGSSHGHATTGSITLEMNGEPLFIDSGRYSYTETETRLELKREAAHNSIQLSNAPATEITESWGYSKLANPIAHSIREVDFGYILKGSWIAEIKNSQNAVLDRTILFFEEPQVVVLYDRIMGYQGEVNINFNLPSEVDVKNITSEQIEIHGQNKIFQIWNNQSRFIVKDTIISPVYNEKEASKRIVSTIEANSSLNSHITVVSSTDFDIEQVFATQNRIQGSTDYIDGVKIKRNKQEFQLYFLKEDVVSGDKLFVSENGIPFYGNVNLIDESGYSKQY